MKLTTIALIIAMLGLNAGAAHAARGGIPGPGFTPGHVPPTVTGPTLPPSAPFNTPPPFQVVPPVTPPVTPPGGTVDPATLASATPAVVPTKKASRFVRVRNALTSAAPWLLVETYFYFAICTKEKEVNPDGWFSQNCYAPDWGVVDAPMPGEYSN